MRQNAIELLQADSAQDLSVYTTDISVEGGRFCLGNMAKAISKIKKDTARRKPFLEGTLTIIRPGLVVSAGAAA